MQSFKEKEGRKYVGFTISEDNENQIDKPLFP